MQAITWEDYEIRKRLLNAKLTIARRRLTELQYTLDLKEPLKAIKKLKRHGTPDTTDEIIAAAFDMYAINDCLFHLSMLAPRRITYED